MAFALMFPNLGDMPPPFGLAKQKIGRGRIACLHRILPDLLV